MPSNARERELSDRLRERVRRLLPAPAPEPRGGRPRADDRACFEGIVFVPRNGPRWEDAPAPLPPGPTCWRRHAGWVWGGCGGGWRAVPNGLAGAGVLDPPELHLDCTFAPARGGATRSASRGPARA